MLAISRQHKSWPAKASNNSIKPKRLEGGDIGDGEGEETQNSQGGPRPLHGHDGGRGDEKLDQ